VLDDRVDKPLEEQAQPSSAPEGSSRAKRGRAPTKEELKKELEEIMRERDKLKEEVEEARSSYATLFDEASRIKADFYNYRQRAEREIKRERQRGAEDILIQLLPVLDNLERALMHLGELDDSPMAKGISMIYKQFLQSLNEAGLQPIPTVGQRFDPALHEAVGVVVTDDAERDGEILEEIERGFTFGGKVLRTAKVKVARYFAKP